jgi:hypothetical protein
MITTLKTPAPPSSDTLEDNGGKRPEWFELGYFEETNLPSKLMALTKAVNRKRCENVKVVHNGESWFLVRDERHLEMVSDDEFLAMKLGQNWRDTYRPEQERAVRLECRRLEKTLVPKECEIPLTRAQAFALIVACWCRPSGEVLGRQSPFAAEIEALI